MGRLCGGAHEISCMKAPLFSPLVGGWRVLGEGGWVDGGGIGRDGWVSGGGVGGVRWVGDGVVVGW